MRTYLEYYKILSLWDTRLYDSEEINLLTGIDIEQIEQCLKQFTSLEDLEQKTKRDNSLLSALKAGYGEEKRQEAYSYILGMYLGDGYISKGSERVLKIRITLDVKYPKIVERCVQELQKLLPENRVNVVDKYEIRRGDRYVSCVEVVCHYKYWHQVFPQHAKGRKHNRSIVLEDWQQRIVDTFPLEFFRGLYHSDGSRSRNFINGKDYPRYFFANTSDEIMKLYTDTVEKLGLTWTQTNRINVAISRREDVEWLDKYVGAKA